MLGVPRSARFLLLVLFVIIVPSIYLLYPHHDHARSPDEEVAEYEAGGIDSAHYNPPIKPNFEDEEIRWRENEDVQDLEMTEEADPTEELVREGFGTSGAISGHRSSGGTIPQDRVHSEDIEGSLVVDGTVDLGDVIMPKLGNATAKAELGRAAWKVMHLMTLRYPDNPTNDDRQALKSYFHLFSRLYPCGECAAEFQKLLKQYPPQTSSRKSASLWLCHVHNMVNERLGKPEFDCLTLDSTYDCGCGPSSTAGAEEAAETAESQGFPLNAFEALQKGVDGGWDRAR